MPNKNYKPKKVAVSYEHLPPPRSRKYADSHITGERTVVIGDNRYLMRNLSCGATELVRYDERANKWTVLCFDGAESTAIAA
jgi:hypothetical protein